MLGASRLGSVVSASAQSTKANSDDGGSTSTADSTTRLGSDLSTKLKHQDTEGPEASDTDSCTTSIPPKTGESKLTKPMANTMDGDDEANAASELFKVKKDLTSDKQSNNFDDSKLLKDKDLGGGEDPNGSPSKRPNPMQLLRKNGLERSSLFAVAKNPIPYVAKSDYVFGQNVHERVVSDCSLSFSVPSMWQCFS